MLSRVVIAGLAGLALASACGKKDKPPAEHDEPEERQRRVIDPPAQSVRPLPPHAIRADGVGPYKLGATVAEILDQLPSGPRIASFTIPDIVHRDMLRAEDDAILIGAEPQGKVTFVAVVASEIARTETGITVGSTRDELLRALGPPLDDPDRARDPRVVVPSKMKNARVILDKDRITAFVVTDSDRASGTPSSPPGSGPAAKQSSDNGCTRPATDRDKNLYGVCLTGAGELFRSNRDGIEVFTRDGERLIATIPVPDLAYAVPLRNPNDGRDDLIAITRRADSQVETWSLSAYRLPDGKPVRTLEAVLYPLTAANARWIGSELRDVDLYLELTSRSDSIEVGGLLTTRPDDKIRDVVVITSIPVSRRRAKTQPHEPVDAGTTDASPEGSSR